MLNPLQGGELLPAGAGAACQVAGAGRGEGGRGQGREDPHQAWPGGLSTALCSLRGEYQARRKMKEL